MTAGVYRLRDPVTREIRYVGQSKNIELRFEAHCYWPTYVIHDWIKGLRAKGFKPILEVVESANPDWDERFEIDVYRRTVLNKTSGGKRGFTYINLEIAKSKYRPSMRSGPVDAVSVAERLRKLGYSEWQIAEIEASIRYL